MTIRQFLLTSHRWLGLTSAMVLVSSGVTGAMLVWPGFGGRVAGPVHDSLASGRVGMWVVLIATMAAAVLQVSGLYLWWRTRTIRIRTTEGWRRFAIDLHNATGAIGLAVMLLIALTGLGRATVRLLDPAKQHMDLRRTISRLHTTDGYPIAVKLVYAVGSIGFAVQGATGVAMWWRRR